MAALLTRFARRCHRAAAVDEDDEVDEAAGGVGSAAAAAPSVRGFVMAGLEVILFRRALRAELFVEISGHVAAI